MWNLSLCFLKDVQGLDTYTWRKRKGIQRAWGCWKRGQNAHERGTDGEETLLLEGSETDD